MIQELSKGNWILKSSQRAAAWTVRATLARKIHLPPLQKLRKSSSFFPPTTIFSSARNLELATLGCWTPPSQSSTRQWLYRLLTRSLRCTNFTMVSHTWISFPLLLLMIPITTVLRRSPEPLNKHASPSEALHTTLTCYRL